MQIFLGVQHTPKKICTLSSALSLSRSVSPSLYYALSCSDFLSLRISLSLSLSLPLPPSPSLSKFHRSFERMLDTSEKLYSLLRSLSLSLSVFLSLYSALTPLPLAHSQAARPRGMGGLSLLSFLLFYALNRCTLAMVWFFESLGSISDSR